MSWVRNGLALSGSDPRLQMRPLGLVITKTRATDAGNYACTAVNDVGSATKDFVVNVLGEFHLLLLQFKTNGPVISKLVNSAQAPLLNLT